MMRFMTPRQQAQHETNMKIVLLALALAVRDMRPGMTGEDLSALIKRVTGEDEVLTLTAMLTLKDLLAR